MEKKAGCHSNSVFQGESTVHFYTEDCEGTLNCSSPKDTALKRSPPASSHLHTLLALTEVSI